MFTLPQLLLTQLETPKPQGLKTPYPAQISNTTPCLGGRACIHPQKPHYRQRRLGFGGPPNSLLNTIDDQNIYIKKKTEFRRKGRKRRATVTNPSEPPRRGARAPPTKVVSNCLLPPLSSQIADLHKSSLKIMKSATNARACTHTQPPEWRVRDMDGATGLGFGRSTTWW